MRVRVVVRALASRQDNDKEPGGHKLVKRVLIRATGRVSSSASDKEASNSQESTEQSMVGSSNKGGG